MDRVKVKKYLRELWDSVVYFLIPYTLISLLLHALGWAAATSVATILIGAVTGFVVGSGIRYWFLRRRERRSGKS